MTLHKYNKKPVFRNFPSANPRISIFDNGINGIEDRDKLLDIINSVTNKSHAVEDKPTSWYKYSDDEQMKWVFENFNLAKTRFSTGSPPIWYGSEDETNSLFEVLYHLKRNVTIDIQHLKDTYQKQGRTFDLEYVENERAMSEAHIDADKITDCTNLKNTISDYSEPSSYNQCIKHANKAIENEAQGLTYFSARSDNEDVRCIAIWDKDTIVESKVQRFYSILIYSNPEDEPLIIQLSKDNL